MSALLTVAVVVLAANVALVAFLLVRYRREERRPSSFDSHAEDALRMVGALGGERR